MKVLKDKKLLSVVVRVLEWRNRKPDEYVCKRDFFFHKFGERSQSVISFLENLNYCEIKSNGDVLISPKKHTESLLDECRSELKELKKESFWKDIIRIADLIFGTISLIVSILSILISLKLNDLSLIQALEQLLK